MKKQIFTLQSFTEDVMEFIFEINSLAKNLITLLTPIFLVKEYR
jgi:hypothetical protein